MAKKVVLVTEKGLEKLRSELEELVKVRRPEVVSRIKNAKELGDLSENAEYSSAKEDQSFIEGRIKELEELLRYAKVAENKKNETVNIGSVITVEVEGDEFDLEIVGETESDPEKGKISIDSPVAKALLGQKSGAKVLVQTPDGAVEYRIAKIV